jgi:general secretion pathway protein B
MSYILDALKKMERDKARKAGPAGMTKLSGDLFREDRLRSIQGGMWKLVTVAVVASLVAVAATWFFLTPSKKKAHVAFRATASPEQMMAAAHDPPATPPVAPQAPVPPAVQPLPQPAPLPVPSQEIQRQEPQTSQLPAARPLKTSSRGELYLQRKDRKHPALSSAAERPVAAAMIAPPADINVSGIAWQDERRFRRAVINGFLLKEGGVVSGARISEIRKDRVRFSQSGRDFEVVMTAPGNSTPAPTPTPALGPAPGNGTGR